MSCLANISNIVVAGSAATVAIVSVIGLKTWRKQLIGASRHETAKKVILAALKTKRAIDRMRSPFGYSFEEEGLSAEKKLASGAESREHRYAKRLKVLLADDASAFELAAFEAEALWGKEATDKTDLLQNCINDLYHAFDIYFLLAQQAQTNRGMGEKLSQEERDSMIQHGHILWWPGREKDEFGRHVEQAVKSIRGHFKKYLHIDETTPYSFPSPR